MPRSGGTFADLFVGGGSVALAVAERFPTARITVNDVHPGIAAFWSVVAHGRTADLAERVEETVPSIDWFERERLRLIEYHSAPDPYGQEVIDVAFATLLLNRISYVDRKQNEPRDEARWRAAILGVGPVPSTQRKIRRRWFRHELVRALHALAPLAGRLEVYNAHAWEVPGEWDCLYLDPPYAKEGPGLYEKSMTPHEHEALAAYLHERDRWVLSHDDQPEVRELYAGARFTEFGATYSAGPSANKRPTKLLVEAA